MLGRVLGPSLTFLGAILSRLGVPSGSLGGVMGFLEPVLGNVGGFLGLFEAAPRRCQVENLRKQNTSTYVLCLILCGLFGPCWNLGDMLEPLEHSLVRFGLVVWHIAAVSVRSWAMVEVSGGR